MLGTFSFEPYFKSYLGFTVWSLEFLEIANRSSFSHLQPACLLALTPTLNRVAHRSRPTPGHLLPAKHPTRRAPALHRPPSLALEASTPRHATPTSPGGRHRDVAVASPLQHPRALSHARMSTTNTPESFSSHSFARSLSPDLRAPPPST